MNIPSPRTTMRAMERVHRILLWIIILVAPAPVAALEFYTIVSDCRPSTGLIIGVDDTAVHILLLEGTVATVPLDTVNALFIYNTLENPVRTLPRTPPLVSYIYGVPIKGDEDPLFAGIAVNFIDELVVFFDITGKTHVLDLYDITRIGPYRPGKHREETLAPAVGVKLNTGTYLSQCPDLGAANNGGINPTRTITDRIRINEFFSDLQQGFLRLDGYRERTSYYARPFLYDERTRFGNYFLVRGRMEEKNFFNPYFQWSNGAPYQFQSRTVVGSQVSDWLPGLEPLWTFSSEIKSHFFNTAMVGNLNLGSLPAGSTFYGYSPLPGNDDPLVAASLNYLLLMGADYGGVSVSVGTYFPVFAFRIRGQAREVLASSTTPVVRAMYTTRRMRFRAIGGMAGYDHRGGGMNNYANILLPEGGISDQVLDSFAFDYWYTRFGFDWDVTPDVRVGASGAVLHGEYRENLGGTPSSLRFTRYVPGIYVHQTVGHYVAVRGIVNYTVMEYRYNLGGACDAGYQHYFEWGGAFELLF